MADSNPILIFVALILTGSLIAFADGWRLPLLALSVQYVFVGALLSHVMPRDLALVKVVVGGFVCAILLITKRPWSLWLDLVKGQVTAFVRLPWRRAGKDAIAATSTEGGAQKPSWSAQSLGRRFLSLSLLALLLLALAIASITLTALWQQRSPTPMPATTGLAAPWMMGMGLLSLASRRTPFHIGLGLLTLVTGFELAYTSLEPSLTIAGLLAVLNIMISLAIASVEAAMPPLESHP